MNGNKLNLIAGAVTLALANLAGTANADVYVQCPGDSQGDAVIDAAIDDGLTYSYPGNERCMHLTGGDGFIRMANEGNRDLYIFSFADVTGIDTNQVMTTGMLAAEFSAPTIVADEGDELYLTMSNVAMVNRPDLFDPHSVHFHGFPNASDIFDGLPEATLSINPGSSITYYYNIQEPGTFMYHCHVEATEHMQMGMLGNLYIRPAQNRLPNGTVLGIHVHSNPDYNADRNQDDASIGDKYVYNDGDASTRYDVGYPLQLGGMDPVFHDASRDTQPLRFANMDDSFLMINGRGYPDTINPATTGFEKAVESNAQDSSNPISSLITATVGEKILLRVSNLNVTEFYTLTSPSLTMRVVGKGAHILRGPDPDGAGPLVGKNLYYDTNSVTTGGGEGKDIIIDTAGVTAGTYYLYAANLHLLSNDVEDFGGMMTKIVISN